MLQLPLSERSKGRMVCPNGGGDAHGGSPDPPFEPLKTQILGGLSDEREGLRGTFWVTLCTQHFARICVPARKTGCTIPSNTIPSVGKCVPVHDFCPN